MAAAREQGKERRTSRLYLNPEQETYVLAKWTEDHAHTTSLSGLSPWFIARVSRGVVDEMWSATSCPTPKGLISLVRRKVFADVPADNDIMNWASPQWQRVALHTSTLSLDTQH